MDSKIQRIMSFREIINHMTIKPLRIIRLKVCWERGNKENKLIMIKPVIFKPKAIKGKR